MGEGFNEQIKIRKAFYENGTVRLYDINCSESGKNGCDGCRDNQCSDFGGIYCFELKKVIENKECKKKKQQILTARKHGFFPVETAVFYFLKKFKKFLKKVLTLVC